MTKHFDVHEVRKDFPILTRNNRGKPIAYLDNAASSQKPLPVIESITNYYRNNNSNVHRGIYELAEDAENHYIGARKEIADYLSVQPDEIIFARGATEALNLVANSFGRSILQPNDIIVLSEMEHHANIVPW